MKNFFQKALNVVIESRRRTAARKLANLLASNPDFRNFSSEELYRRILAGNLYS